MIKAIFKRLLVVAAFIPVMAIGQTEITLEDIHSKGTFRSKSVAGFNSMNDGESYCRFVKAEKGGRDLVKYSFESNENLGVIFNTEDIKDSRGRNIKVQGYSFSDDEKLVLIYDDRESIYRHSFRAKYYVLNLETKNIMEVSKGEKVRYATISPNNKYVAYVSGNNLYYRNLENKRIVQITTDGEKNKIINGAVDWVYEEEFSMSRGFEWSPNGDQIAYYRFDESAVPEFTMPIYGNLYPNQETWKYPKAGEKNSRVDLFIYNIGEKRVTPFEIGAEKDQYLPRIKWTKNNDVLSAQRLNRHQNHWELLFINVKSMDVSVALEEKSKYYIEVKDGLSFLNDGESFIYSSETDGYNHLYRHNFSKGKTIQITSGEWDVMQFHGINESKGLLYYSSSEVSATQKQMYSIKLSGKGKRKLTVGEGYHTISFSKGMKYYLENYSSMDKAPEYSLNTADGEQIQILEDNSEFMSKLESYDLSPTTFSTLTTEDNVSLNYWMIKPPNFDPAKKYPMLMYVYGGPGINTVNNRWGGHYFWYQMLAQKGYIVVSVDATGTGYRGAEFKKKTYMQLGNYESRDQIASAKYFGNLDYIDETRVGIWGWSYGGYMSSLCLAKGNKVFKMAMAVAPVTNWRYYDNVYTERFMRTPQENAQGYDTNSPINHVEKIKGNYLIVHGTADDNVHFQNAVEMISEMVSKNVAFDSELYPNKNHSIYGGKTRLHLFTRLTKYVEENL